ncbi:MAG: pentapeptide repeat-containing protein [Rhodoferax sp.]|nr:pentapeptide repeat-containing protein [Rhodoferax sp.]
MNDIDLRNADLRAADLRPANLIDASLEGAELPGARIDASTELGRANNVKGRIGCPPANGRKPRPSR